MPIYPCRHDCMHERVSTQNQKGRQGRTVVMPCPCLGEAVALLRVAGGQCHVAQQAEARWHVRVGVVAGRAYQRKPLGAGTALVGGSNGVHHSKRRADSLYRRRSTLARVCLRALFNRVCVG